jgi:hypothetical protein
MPPIVRRVEGIDFESRRSPPKSASVLHDQPEDQDALRSDPAVIERWYQALVRMKKSVEGTLAAKTADSKAQKLQCLLKTGDFGRAEPDLVGAQTIEMEYQRWRAGAIRFKVGVEEKLMAVRWLRSQAAPQLIASAAVLERNIMAERVRRLEAAIRAHRDQVLRDGGPHDGDDQLWNLADPRAGA